MSIRRFCAPFFFANDSQHIEKASGKSGAIQESVKDHLRLPRTPTSPSFTLPSLFLYWSMELTDEDIVEYQVMWKEEFGEEISTADARRSASELLELFRVLFFESSSVEQEEE